MNKNKLDLIRDLAKATGITAYEIGQKTSISLTSARNILENDSITPRKKTLDIVLNFLLETTNNNPTGEELKEEYTTAFRNRKVAEEPIDYQLSFKDLKIDDKLNIIYQQNLEVNKKIELITTGLSNLILDFEESEILKQKSKA